MIPVSHIVLDKSYLQGCTNLNLRELTRKHRIIVCAETFHEVVTSPADQMKSCINKLLAITTSVDLLDHNGRLLNFEIENKKPCKPLSNHILPITLNPKWNYTISKQQNKTVTDFHRLWEVDGSKGFEEIVLEIISTCGRSTPGQVATDRETILKAYGYLRSTEKRLPRLNNLNEDWAIYRRLQVQLIAAYEYMDSFQEGRFCMREDRKAHNQIDFRVLIAALLAGGVATRDKLIKRYFSILCPAGTLLWLNK